jgi:hypothetical protein
MVRASIFALGLSLACGGAPKPLEVPEVTRGEPLDFAFGALDGSVVTGENTRGRVTLILFVTTFDLPSQAASRRLADFVRSHVPKVNAVAIVLEAAENAVLVDVFRKSLNLSYTVALADSVELRASEAFSNVHGVPTLVVLDREGRLVEKFVGLFEPGQLDAWVKDAQR